MAATHLNTAQLPIVVNLFCVCPPNLPFVELLNHESQTYHWKVEIGTEAPSFISYQISYN